METRKPKRVDARSVITALSYLFIITCLLAMLSCFGYMPDDEEFEEAFDLLEGKDQSEVIETLELLLPKLKNPEIKSKCLYLIATYHRRAERWREAIAYYESALEGGEFIFSDLASLHIAIGYKTIYDYGSAIEWYEQVLGKYPDTFSAVEARYQIGECYSMVKQYNEAIRHYTKFVETYPEEKRVRMASYKIGLAYQEIGKWPEAYIRYQGLIRQNARDDIARSALSKIESLIASDPTISVTREDHMYYGMALYHALRYRNAREEFQKVIQMNDSDDSAIESAYLIAESYYRERKYSTAIGKYAHVAKKYPQSDYALTSQYQIALCQWKLGKGKESNALLAKFAAAHPESNLADNAEFEIAQHHKSKGKYKDAADAYSKVVTDFPADSLADDSLWNIGWCHIKLKDYNASEQALQRLIDEYPDSSLAGSARFWKSMSLERVENWQAAVDSYRESAQSGDWYYSDRSKRRLELLARRGKIGGEMAAIQYEKVKIDDSIPAWQNVSLPVPTRAQELLDLRIYDDAVGELLMAVETAVALEGAYYNLSLCYNNLEDYNNSWRYAWRLSRLPGIKNGSGAMPGQLHRMMYPMAYRETVFSNSEKNKLDPLLVLALMREESSYEPTAISHAGAMGLIQIMPPTGGDIAKRLKIQPFEAKMLLQPELNIRMGTWHLSGLVKRFGERVQKISTDGSDHSDIVKILSSGAYNGGEARMQRWVERYGIEDIDEFIENIPIYETGRYIKKVCHSYEMYKSIYSE